MSIRNKALGTAQVAVFGGALLAVVPALPIIVIGKVVEELVDEALKGAAKLTQKLESLKIKEEQMAAPEEGVAV